MSQIRVARPTRALAATASFYADAVGLPMLASFDGHDPDGYWLVLSPDAR